MVWVRQAARRLADASGAGDGLFLCWYSEETGHGALLPLAIDTSPGRARRLPDASEAARVLWCRRAPQSGSASPNRLPCAARADASVYNP